MKRYESILVVSDNESILRELGSFILQNPDVMQDRRYDYACHPNTAELLGITIGEKEVKPIDIKRDFQAVIDEYDLVISAHCKQIFPKKLVEARKCINIHPGYNPHNRGWYPQVFSIVNEKPLGATIHEIDNEIDHGNIIDREQVSLSKKDTSLTAYNKVLETEFKLIKKNFAAILDGTYTTYPPESEGNINLKKDFNAMLELELDQKVTMGEAIDILRALTHPPHRNAFFIDPDTFDKIWVSINLEVDESSEKS